MTDFNPAVLEPHPPAVKNWCFEIYVFLCDQNAVKTAERINDPQDGDEWEKPEREVPARTIREWAKTGRWAEAAAKKFRDLAPGIHNQVDQTIMAGSSESASYLRSVVNNSKESTKFRVDAAKTLLDRSGHMPYIRPSDDSKPRGPVQDYSDAIAGKTTDSLLSFILGELDERAESEDAAIIEVDV